MNRNPSTYRKRVGMVAVSGFILLDAVVTTMFVSKHGLEAEANPLMRHVMETGGFASLFLVKFAVIALYWTAMVWYKDVKGYEYSLWPEKLLLLIFVPVCVAGFFLALV